MKDRKLSRRDFVAVTSGVAAAGLLGQSRSRADAAETQQRSRVVLVRSHDVLGESDQPDRGVLHDMLNRGVTELLEEKNPQSAWERLISSSDVVGIKSNVWGPLATPTELEEAIRSEVLAVGVKPDDISVDDRGVRTNPVFKRATAIINTRPLRTHNWSGLGTLIKNLITYVPRPADYHGDSCAPLGAIWNLPEVKGKVRLNVLVMLTPQFHGVGPHSFSREYVWPYRGLILGTDPVAVDATGARIIEAKRRLYFGEDRPISPPPHHIEIAGERYGLGISDPERIDLVRLGWMDQALI